MSNSSNRKFIHIVLDEKFIDTASARFEAVAPGENIFIIPKEKTELKYIRSTEVTFLTKNDLKDRFLVRDYKAVIFHSLPQSWHDLIEFTSPYAKILWIGWGFDYYDTLLAPAYPQGLLLPRTKRINENLTKLPMPRMIASYLKRTFVSAASVFKERLPKPYYRIDYFSPVLESEFILAKQFHPKFNASYIDWDYQTLIETGPTKFDIRDDLGDDILIGNSASVTSNHADVLCWLKETTDIGTRKVVIPLNYGDKKYAEAVSSLSKRLFGQNVAVITDWMSLGQYKDLLRSCGYGVFGHLRQQARGMIGSMLRQGSRIAIHSQSPSYIDYINCGYPIEDLKELMSTSTPLNLDPLSHEEFTKLSEANPRYYEYAPTFKKTRALVNKLSS